jgi:3',5'-cyclic AMP phosphodiesterase CpdA
MTRIAHLTDPHLLEPGCRKRSASDWARINFLSILRPLDPLERRNRFARALAAARAARPDHLVITGDLTEDGTAEQFETLAEVLSESRIPADGVTLVPGNHDVYSDANGWEKALAGPLQAYASTSNDAAVVALRGAAVVPMWTAFGQPYVRSAGKIDPDKVDEVARLVKDRRFSGAPIVLAQHHPPHPHWLPLVHWIDGLQGHGPLMRLIESQPQLFVVHGHSHYMTDRRAAGFDAPRIFSGAAVVDGRSPLRIYEARGETLCPMVEDAAAGLGPCLAVA